jgi:energy-coupling factor transporter ATP-binding protein EcfA2
MHLYCIGKSGSGKSTLLQNMAIDDIEKNNGLCVVDPHGDLSESLLDYIPHDRIDDVIYFNPADTEFPIAFNPLRNVHPEFYELTVSGLLSMFQNIWSDHWGPRLAHILRFSLLTLIEYRKASLLDIQPLLTDPAYRATVLTYVTNDKLRCLLVQ